MGGQIGVRNSGQAVIQLSGTVILGRGGGGEGGELSKLGRRSRHRNEKDTPTTFIF